MSILKKHKIVWKDYKHFLSDKLKHSRRSKGTCQLVKAAYDALSTPSKGGVGEREAEQEHGTITKTNFPIF